MFSKLNVSRMSPSICKRPGSPKQSFSLFLWIAQFTRRRKSRPILLCYKGDNSLVGLLFYWRQYTSSLLPILAFLMVTPLQMTWHSPQSDIGGVAPHPPPKWSCCCPTEGIKQNYFALADDIEESPLEIVTMRVYSSGTLKFINTIKDC